MSIFENLKSIKEDIDTRANLIAVSKTKPTSMIKEALEAGQLDFGENKVQDLHTKSIELENENIHWHFMGKLQSNKINQLLKSPNLVSIHSIDSIKLLDKILNKKIDKVIGLFIQVNTSDEDEKNGFSIGQDFQSIIQRIDESSGFEFKGFMTIGKIRTDNFELDAQKSFVAMRGLKAQYGQNRQIELSMGMSNDYKIALDYGSNWLRIGSSIFGKR
jgi:pyridoxal phosphate enzyme (YggS family)